MKTVIKANEIEFVPYKTILIGSNEISCKYLININGYYPIIIGKDVIPRIWLYAMVNGNEVVLVNDSKESFNRMKVRIDEFKKEISVVLKENQHSDIVVLSASFEKEDVFNIKKLDLTPIGLSVISDENKMKIGSNIISRNVVKGVNSFIALSDK